MTILTPYKAHVEKWKNCQGWESCKKRKNVVFLRGSIPCEVLFIGEAPGPSEDVLAKPFVGPAGKLLDNIIYQAWATAPRYALTNLVSCIPLDDESNKFGEPPEESIKACAERLAECIKLSRPKILVCVGKLANKWMAAYSGIKQIEIMHPAAILRADVTQRGLLIKRAVVALRDVLEDL